ncbi:MULTISPECIES: helix-turn-helix domain-containing protein [unclassified Microbacterium]|uniref:helix-turn-helix domain-containing protein n=1 Tax=unclassified Microbacterium TaxID=2609290 RepID=UPI00214C0410|nr:MULTISPECIES: helix-turn-helix domain-containing protein [unclassified Microbacterium]MCR2784073.1 helix-turn-helix domain-containing protein [Microbacterium sp. zg.B96]MDL5351009.1 helix-turn-helix domain-containing protein [Microbacterium sp. zg-YB36]WIM15087.1 helix-turn-helix domain-containing protein [Microbacterium sp. zg-B96]
MTAIDELTRWALSATVSGNRQVGAWASKCVLIALCQYANQDLEAWPSADSIAADVGMTRRDARNALDALEHNRLIERASRQVGRSTRWVILADLAGYPATKPAGDVAGNLAGDVAGNLAGDVAGFVAGYPATKGKEENKKGGASDLTPLSPYCAIHPLGTDQPCRPCGEARKRAMANTARQPAAVFMRTVQPGVHCAPGTHRTVADGTCIDCDIRADEVA